MRCFICVPADKAASHPRLSPPRMKSAGARCEEFLGQARSIEIVMILLGIYEVEIFFFWRF
jgi:hypothetical protein